MKMPCRQRKMVNYCLTPFSADNNTRQHSMAARRQEKRELHIIYDVLPVWRADKAPHRPRMAG